MLEALKETCNMQMPITDWILSSKELSWVAILPVCVDMTTGAWPSLTSAHYMN